MPVPVIGTASPAIAPKTDPGPAGMEQGVRLRELAGFVENVGVSLLVSLSPHASVRLAEIGFLLMVISGVWLAVAQLRTAFQTLRMVVAGILLAAAGVLLIVATHWGTFG